MQRRETILKHLRILIANQLDFAGYDQKLGDVTTECYRRGMVTGFATGVRRLIEEGSPEWLEMGNIQEEQRKRVMALKEEGLHE